MTDFDLEIRKELIKSNDNIVKDIRQLLTDKGYVESELGKYLWVRQLTDSMKLSLYCQIESGGLYLGQSKITENEKEE